MYIQVDRRIPFKEPINSKVILIERLLMRTIAGCIISSCKFNVTSLSWVVEGGGQMQLTHFSILGMACVV